MVLRGSPEGWDDGIVRCDCFDKKRMNCHTVGDTVT